MIAFTTPIEALEKIANLIRQRRIRLNISQVQLSQKSTVSLATIRKFERTGKISFESFLKISFVLDLMNEIIDLLENKNKNFSSMDDLLKDKPLRKRASRISKSLKGILENVEVEDYKKHIESKYL